MEKKEVQERKACCQPWDLLYFPGNISKNCTSDGWSEIFPDFMDACGYSDPEKGSKVRALRFSSLQATLQKGTRNTPPPTGITRISSPRSSSAASFWPNPAKSQCHLLQAGN